MFRGTLKNVLSAERLDRLFTDKAKRQYLHELTFSTCVELLGLVVTQIRPSVNAAYRTRRERIGVSVQSLYQKLSGIEPAVSEALVQNTAADLGAIIDRMNAAAPGPLRGFDVRIVDGNYLQGTHHRLKELRRVGDAALPGHTLSVLCLAVVMYNALSTAMAALRVAHPEVTTPRGGAVSQPKFSFYYLADEIAGVWRGMALVIPAPCWTKAFAYRTPAQMAKLLLWLARKGQIEPFLTNPVRVKKRKQRRIIQHGGHISTYQILQQRKHPEKQRLQ